MKVNVAQLRRTDGGAETFLLSESFPPLQMGSEQYIFRIPLDVKLDVVNVGKSLLVKGSLRSEIIANCSRCLKGFPFPLEFEFEDEWISVELVSQELEDSVLIFEKDEIFIDERILEHVLLHLPMKFLCSEDCKGLCLKCGADLNLNPCNCSNEEFDPRMEILSKWNKGV